jgi:hypothetical protein
VEFGWIPRVRELDIIKSYLMQTEMDEELKGRIFDDCRAVCAQTQCMDERVNRVELGYKSE